MLIGGVAFYIHRTNRQLAVAIAEKTYSEEALKKSEEWHRIIFETSPSAGVVWQPGFVIVAWNRQAEVLFGWRREEVIGRSFAEFLIPEDEKADLLPRLYHEKPDGQPQLMLHCISRNLTRDGRAITCEWFNACLQEAAGGSHSIISLATDITERQRLEEQIQQLAFYDGLTNLPNRRLLLDRFDQAVAALGRSDQRGALLFLDLDNFKPLNDQHGHDAGDQLLVGVARRLQRGVRACDTVARLGGDEFIVLLCGLDADQAQAMREAETIAGKLRAMLVEPYILRNPAGITIEHRCAASIGIALFDACSAAESTLRDADMAMYRAKEGGRKLRGSLQKSGQ